MHVLANISTKDRFFTTLPQALLGVAMQTRPPDGFVLFQDGEHKDLRGVSCYDSIFDLYNRKKIGWEWLYAEHRGQHVNHQMAQERAKELVWRVDDDAVPESNVLETLVKHFIDPKVGAVGGQVLVPNMPLSVPEVFVSSRIEDVKWAHNPQWYPQTGGVREVDHLHCSFVYRKGLVAYDTSLSPVAHREETIFTYELRRAGYKVLLDPSVTTWHLRQSTGGIRSWNNPGMYAHDEAKFDEHLKNWGVTPSVPIPLVVLDCGLGDHLAFQAKAYHMLRTRHGDRIAFAVCYPDVFTGYNATLLSIGQAAQILGNLDPWNVYRFMDESKWTGKIADAFVELYRKMNLL